MAMTDRLTLVRALEDSGMQREAADRVATEIYGAIYDNVATKTDVTAIRTDIEAVRFEIKTDVAAVRADMREMELRLEAKIDRVVIRLGSMLVIATGLLVAIKYFG